MRKLLLAVLCVLGGYAGYSQSCTGSLSVSITGSTEGTPIDATFNTTQPNCNTANGALTGAIDVTTTGGNPAYIFEWFKDGATTAYATTEDIIALGAGSYVLEIEDQQGCTFTVGPIVITEPVPLALNPTVSQPLCNEANGDLSGSIYIEVTGGTGTDYDFSWTGADVSAATDSLQADLGTGTYAVTVTDENGCTATASYTLTEPDPIVITETLTQPSCNPVNGDATGEIAIAVSGGTGTYDFDWTGAGTTATSQDQTVLYGGTYAVTVTDDNGCTATATYTLTDPVALSITETIDQPDCNSASGDLDGSISIMVAGGSPTYTYAWTGPGVDASAQNQTDLGAGTYTVVVTDDNTCTTSATYTLTEPTAIAASALSPVVGNGATNILCNGGTGTVEVSASGGTGTLQYSIDGTNFQNGTTFTDVLAGTYTITVKDANDCTGTTTVTLTEPTPLVAGSCTDAQDLCQLNEGEIKIEASGGVAPYDVTYTGGTLTPASGATIPTSGANQVFTGATGGTTYNFTVTDDNGCVVN